ncbi:MAG: 30S ribosomal protein S13 [Spirochaetota bacterium]|nr:30S ribosomal protein S13 [Spirochaetota bacterium]
MARIASIDLPANKRIDIALTYIFGIGRPSAADICEKTGVNPGTRVRDLVDDEITLLRSEIEKKYKVEGDLRTEVQMNIKRLMDIGCYRGIRHRKGLPVRGQRTHTNSRTRRGVRKNVIGKNKKK